MAYNIDPTGMDAANQGEANYILPRLAALESEVTTLQAQVDSLQGQADPPPAAVWSEPWNDLSNWGVYNGAGSYSSEGVRLTGNVEVIAASGSDPNLCRVHVRAVGGSGITIGGHTLASTDFAAGGVYPKDDATHVGKWGPGHKWVTTIRMSAPAYGTRGVFMLWGDNTGGYSWPASGEYDVAEDGSLIPNRDSTKITYHDANSAPTNQVTQDMTQWVTLEVQWPADSSKLVVLFNGTQVDEVDAPGRIIFAPGLASFRFQTALEGGGQSPTYSGSARQASYIDCGPINIYAM